MKDQYVLAAIVSTPMQHMFAVERLQACEHRASILVVLHSPEDYGEHIFERLPGFDQWSRVVFVAVRYPRVSGIMGRFRRVRYDLAVRSHLKDVIRKLRFSESVLMGHPINFWHRAFVRSIRHDRCIVVDDGLLTLNLDFENPDFFRESIAERIRRMVLRLPFQSSLDEIELFSVLPFTSEKHKTVENDIEFLGKQISPSQKVSQQTWFIGQPLSAAGLMSVDAYVSALLEVKARHGTDHEFVYCPHPQERSSGVAEEVSRRLGWKLRANDRPIELELLRVDVRPKKIATFYSSVILTVPKIFGERLPVEVYVLDYNRHLLPSMQRANVIRLYDRVVDLFRDNGAIQIVNL